MTGPPRHGDSDLDLDDDLAMILKIVNENLKMSELATHKQISDENAELPQVPNEALSNYKRKLLLRSEFSKML